MADDDLLNRARVLAVEGRYLEAAPLYEEGARALLQRLDLPTASSVLVAAARLYAMGGAIAEAEALLDTMEGVARGAGRLGEWARARAELAEQRGEPALRRERWRAARDHGDPDQQLHALAKLADEARERGAVAEGAAYLSTAAQLAETHGRSELMAAALIELASFRTAATERQSARVLLDRAEPHVGDNAVLRARLEGQRGVIALAEGRAEDALRHGLAAREAAVRAAEPQVYLPAAMLITMVHEHEDRLVEAYDTMIRARESLRDLLGDQGAALVQPALQLFEERLGERGIASVRDAWEAMRRAAKA